MKIPSLFLKLTCICVIVVGGFTSCIKKSDCNFFDAPVTAPEVEITYLRDWLETAGIPFTAHPAGAFYVVHAEGAGANPQICSNIKFRYTGKLLNGSVFESNSEGITVILGQLIVGLQKTLPRIKQGGSITVYVPPFLGYGYQDHPSGRIPAESYLIFDVELLNVD
ncbi:MAG TPA: FKBP-type peptidyl-prolyl cis-trans isomerase [Ferruginibacter sp.]|nr:FKBP-type peptidyl-prolyl cis-trans isomerase [Ferruginibacter sp.]HRO18436.1 FKBP-type peptidyl-prolyl cis-trans isomerase [Ferruginibacter sp.]HRQ21639.1 FKBP-type peptidyl-prolyl cis-trans isomerase [Ferruginibacter sp.]